MEFQRHLKMEIECEFVADSSGNGNYNCKVTRALIDMPNVDIVSFEEKHQMGKFSNDVTSVDFHNVKAEYFPRNLQRIFPSMETLSIKNSDLKAISRQDLVGLHNLVRLDVSNNQLKSLPDDLFSNMPNLKFVCFDGNNIKFATSKLIKPIIGNQLVWFYLRKNTNIDEFYYSGVKTGCRTMLELMAKIDEKCTPPTPPKPPIPSKPPMPSIISTAARRESNSDAAESAIRKFFSEHRRLDRYSDFVITVGSKEFPVHKSYLAQQSSVFGEMFKVKTDGRFANKLEISDSSAEGVEAFLDYLYDRRQPVQQNAVEIFKLAVKYKVAELKTLCEKIIRETLDESNAFAIFSFACGPHKSEELKIAAFRKLQEKLGIVLSNGLINNPEKLQKIVEAKELLDDLIKEDLPTII